VVETWRRAHSPDGAAGMPAHLTVLYPFAPVEEVDLERVRELAAATGRFSFELVAVHEWPDGVVWLAPRPAEPFVRLIARCVERFPSWPPYGGIHDEIVPHLTVVHTEDAAVRAAASESVAGSVPIRCEANELSVMHRVDGRWTVYSALPF
jgi:hypothetical protein